jgi:hypothetical protein
MWSLVAGSSGDGRNPTRGRPGWAGKGRGSGLGSSRDPFRGFVAAEEQSVVVLSDGVEPRPPLLRLWRGGGWGSATGGHASFSRVAGRCRKAQAWSGGDRGDRKEELTNRWPWRTGEETRDCRGRALERRWPFIEASSSWRRGHDDRQQGGHGMGMAWPQGGWRRAAASGQWSKAAAPSGGWESAAWHRPGHSRASHTGAKAQRTDRWSQACTYGEVRQRANTAHRRRRARARSRANANSV